ncbi:hypothetical protein BCR37DRAFT_110274 [Protomyces lactucae-debilis]|uniref:Uncharacterized protein n=1 Tax=Protomyces lactucae-debilis TaxID=2754530 RepID=A0A1Y2F5M4_PROLT|nr:uncharacterized protein BCR37DRAFT_110274 [Protomyces lactucae-debilis]ORY78646.1 hypothetical protein BCR37DRAFT_110274 [Protomyces lactucae-debilis]
MPTPIDRSLPTLTPPSSASTNGDYWTASPNTHIPLSESQARSHSLPGTPAQTPPAPQYMPSHMQQPYIGSSLANGDGNMPRGGPPSQHPGAAYMGPRYGQQPDTQRMYSTQHSRNPSMMSYENEDMSIESSSVALTADHASVNNGVPPPPAVAMQHAGSSQGAVASLNGHHARQRSQQIRGALPSPGGRHAPVFDQNGQPMGEMRLPGLASSNAAGSSFSTHSGPQTPGGSRSHARTQSRGSTGKVFSTPNLTTQMTRWAGQTPNGSPTKGTTPHSRQHSRDAASMGQGPSSVAASWVQQQQQMAFSTPQQAARVGGHPQQSQQHAGGLPQIFEETPSCRMAYQLHGTRAESGAAGDMQADAGQSQQPHRAGGQSAPRFVDYGQPADEHGNHGPSRQHPMQSPIVPGSAPNLGLGLDIGRAGSPRARLGLGLESPLSGKTKRDRTVSDGRDDEFAYHQPPPPLQQSSQQRGQFNAPPRYGYGQQDRNEDYAPPSHASERVLQSPLNGSTPGSGGKNSDAFSHGSASQQQHQQPPQHALVRQYRTQQQQQQQVGDYQSSPRGSPTPPPLLKHDEERPSARRQRSFQ